jgi:hypothetical protein
MRKILLFIVLLNGSSFLFSQEGFDNWLEIARDAKIQPFLMTQFWSAYSTGMEVYNEELGIYEPVEDRFNFQLRRMRLGFRAQPYKNLKFVLVTSYDLVGRDVLSAQVGGTNNGAVPNFGIWDAFLQWKFRSGSEHFNLVAGYFRPQFGRESITSGWSTNSMEKSMSQNYIRRHLVGKGPGRAPGVNLGGLFLGDKIGFNYNIGVFNPLYHDLSGNSTGAAFSPLLSGRAVFFVGDPESQNYKIGYDINYFNERKGLSVALAGAWQSKTALFAESKALGIDLLFNWGPLNVDADWSFMFREGERAIGEEQEIYDYSSNTGHVRLGYNLILNNRFFIEPSFMLMQFNGGLTEEEQINAAMLGAFSGKERTYDLGLNWYLNRKRLKLLLHYTWREGEAGAAGPGATVNQYFSQSGVGAIRRGNWLGLGLNAIF